MSSRAAAAIDAGFCAEAGNRAFSSEAWARDSIDAIAFGPTPQRPKLQKSSTLEGRRFPRCPLIAETRKILHGHCRRHPWVQHVAAGTGWLRTENLAGIARCS
jgi:hypothetical protein